MEVSVTNNDIILTNVSDFNLRHIFDCGQCFRFNSIDENTYFGIAGNHALKISQHENTVILYDTPKEDFYNIWYNYFDFNTDYARIKNSLRTDKHMELAVDYGCGIRILRQDLWETVISFIISASNNIPRIKGIIERLCENFGNKIEYMGKIYYGFPGIEKLASLSSEDLAVIRSGFRDKYIMDAADKFYTGEISEDTLKSSSDPKKLLLTVKGIGEKVANCILLFGFGKRDAFPVDVWIKRIMEYCYFDSEMPNSAIAEFAGRKFGSLGGYAQQYLFFWARDNGIGV